MIAESVTGERKLAFFVVSRWWLVWFVVTHTGHPRYQP
jgi:hypothetical protein